jgi:hypothetical protein
VLAKRVKDELVSFKYVLALAADVLPRVSRRINVKASSDLTAPALTRRDRPHVQHATVTSAPRVMGA